MSPYPPMVTGVNDVSVMLVVVLTSSSFSAAWTPTVGRVVMTGTLIVMPAAGVESWRVLSRNGRAGSMMPIISVRNASGTTPRLSVVMSSAATRISISRWLTFSPASMRNTSDRPVAEREVGLLGLVRRRRGGKLEAAARLLLHLVEPCRARR